MIKKSVLLLTFIMTLFAIFGCTNETSTTTTVTSISSSETESTTTTQNPNSLLLHIPADCTNVEIVDGWVPTWCEEFDYEGAVDSTKWRHQTGGGGYGNNELQNYTSRPENAYVDGDKLIITALREDYGNEDYTSAKIWTQGVKNWKYGKFEIRAKVPAGVGTWPAFWMMPKSSVYGGWPASGEIDILEHTANFGGLNKAVGSIHTLAYNHKIGTQISYSRFDATLSSEFHTYSIIWNEFSITWYLDGSQYGKTTFNPLKETSVNKVSDAWPFDQEFYLIINLAMGGAMGGTVDPNFVSDTFEIDYVRVFQQDYGMNDYEAPTSVTNLQAVKAVNTKAYMFWTRATDNEAIKRYNIYVDGVFLKSVGVNMYIFNNLTAGQEYTVEVEAEDYAGNVSEKESITVKTTIVS
ncbi:MAG: glycoside hydrolase [Tenericutes bacterium HGW-Tenericutes-1]|jgi:beta-glucanase (GH16 family)|nr:MAG: glycoside hydrolase [Tenericutes bacterium HGW-Tenericutes-1]